MSSQRLPKRKPPLPDLAVILKTDVVKFPKEPHSINSKFLDRCRHAAEICGYSLTVHGTMMRDIDVVAVAWTYDADSFLKFLAVFLAQTGCYLHSLEEKPHGRIGMTLRGAHGQDRDLDMSVIPPNRG